jgi:citrate synthase
MPASARLIDRVRVAAVVLGAADPMRFDLSSEAIVGTAERLIGVLVDSMTDAPARGGLAARLWPALSAKRPKPALLNAALILLADHDLAVSTVAARVAASARAPLYAVLSAGLGAVDGQYHGAASGQAHRFLADAMTDPVGALSEQLRADGHVPGFGHRVYRARDPRAEVLFGLLRAVPAAKPVMAAVAAVAAELSRNPDSFPNVDLALAALMHAFGMRADAGEAVFAVARTVGWVAHALEEYREPGLRFRPLGVYTGIRPGRS